MSESSELLEKMAATTREFFRGGMFMFFGLIASMILNYIFNVFLARSLGNVNYGVFALGFSVFQILYVTAPTGLEQGVVRFVSIYTGEDDRRGALAIIINSFFFAGIISIVLAGGLFVFSGWISHDLYQEPALKPVLMIFAAALLFSTPFMVTGGALQGLKRLELKALVQNFLEPGFRLLVVAVLLILGTGLMGAVISYPAAYLLAIILGLYFLRRILGWHARGWLSRTYYNPLLRFSAPLLIGVILGSLNMRLDRLFLGYFVPSQEVGLVDVCNRYAMMISILLYAFNFMFAPFISSLHNQQRMEELEGLLKMMARWMVAGSAPLFILIMFYNHELLRIFGQYFVEGDNLLIILAVGQFLSVVLGTIGLVVVMTGHPWVEVGNMTFGFVLFIILNLVLIPRYGALGAVIANATVTGAINIPRLLEAWGLFRIHPFSRRFLALLLIAAFSGALAFSSKFLLKDFSMVIQLAIPGIIFVLLYGLLAFRFGLTSSEKDMLRSFISMRK
jgi:O-antigen/teichoic acid export membrane protein